MAEIGNIVFRLNVDTKQFRDDIEKAIEALERLKQVSIPVSLSPECDEDAPDGFKWQEIDTTTLSHETQQMRRVLVPINNHGKNPTT